MTKDNAIYAIYETTNYDQFVFSDNREITNGGVSTAVDNLKATRNTCLVPIVVSKVKNKLVVRDGQHRLLACKSLNIPVKYFISKEIVKSDVVVLQGGKPWHVLNYIENNAESNPYPFKKLMNFYQTECVKIGIRPGTMGVLFINRAFTTKVLRSSKLTLTDENFKTATANIKKLQDIFAASPKNVKSLKNEQWIKVLITLMNHPNYNHKHFLKRIKGVTSSLLTSRKKGPITFCVMQIFNKGLIESNKVQLT